MKLSGVITALVTPFNTDGSVDYGKLKELVNFQIENGVSGILPMGTTGESPTVSNQEHPLIIQTVVEQTAKRVPVIAGTGSNCTEEAVKMTKIAADLGADMTLQVAPYYNKPNQEGFFRHFSEIANKCSIPTILYNIPGRSAKNIEPQTILKLAQHNNIIGVKEASGSIPQAMEIIHSKPDDFLLFSGDDNLTLPLTSIGGNGVISVISNIIPKEMSAFVKLALEKESDKAIKEHYRLFPLFKAMFLDTNPIPVKTALALMGKIEGNFRLPMCEMSQPLKSELELILKKFNLI